MLSKDTTSQITAYTHCRSWTSNLFVTSLASPAPQLHRCLLLYIYTFTRSNIQLQVHKCLSLLWLILFYVTAWYLCFKHFVHAFYMILNLYDYRRYKKLQSINNFSHICFMRVENKKKRLNVVYDFNFRRVNLNKKTTVQHCYQSL